jgi:hypothetical protein
MLCSGVFTVLDSSISVFWDVHDYRPQNFEDGGIMFLHSVGATSQKYGILLTCCPKICFKP